MSYDLYFQPRAGDFDAAKFEAYFTGRPNYEFKSGQAFYSNEDTGVYFYFELGETQATDEEGSPEQDCPVAFNMNFFRPSYFAFEAAPEVTAFVKAFDMTIHDPQVDGMGIGEFEVQRFVTGWNKGNEIGYGAILNDPEFSPPATLPTSTQHYMWRWNFGRNRLQATLGEDVYVPPILVFRKAGDVVTATLWPDAIPIAVPEVDYFLVGRDELAPRRFLRRAKDLVAVKRERVMPELEAHRSPQHREHFVLGYGKAPKQLADFVTALPAGDPEIERLGLDQVLDRELVEQQRRSR